MSAAEMQIYQLRVEQEQTRRLQVAGLLPGSAMQRQTPASMQQYKPGEQTRYKSKRVYAVKLTNLKDENYNGERNAHTQSHT